jgi:hypothetical protein
MTDAARRHLERLEAWIPSARPWITTISEARGDQLVYGTGFDQWGVQTQQKAMSGFAIAALHPQFRADAAGISRDELVATALGLLRFNLASHKSGPGACLDGHKWGHTWISALGIERMMHAVDGLMSHLSKMDRRRLRTVLLSEGDWLLDHYPVAAGLIEHNHPESNLWNGCLLHRTALMYPDAPRASQYRDKGTRFLINSISVPSDASLDTLIERRPVREWHAGANFFETLACNHHGYLNVGYMVICLSNIAMLYFSCRTEGWKIPEALLWHARALWELVKGCTYPDGRLLRIGGDTRVRYCYCQDYALPAWLLAQDRWGDQEAAGFETRWLDIVASEQARNTDGSFLGERCRQLREASPLYFTRLETDRAAVFGMAAWWRHRLGDPLATPKPSLSDVESAPPVLWRDASGPNNSSGIMWHDEYHGACLHRGRRRAASFCWRAAEPPQALCLPLDDSSLAEWRCQLGGIVIGMGAHQRQEVMEHQERFFHGGFVTWGTTRCLSEETLAEGMSGEIPALIHTVCAALPDDATMLVLQRATMRIRTWLRGYHGFQWLVPNDVFNGGKRTIHTEAGVRVWEGAGSPPETSPVRGNWWNVDDRLGVIRMFGAPLTHVHPGNRQIGIRRKPAAGGMLHAEELCAPLSSELACHQAGHCLWEGGWALVASATAQVTAKAAQQAVVFSQPAPHAHAVVITGQDGSKYLLAVNWNDRAIDYDLVGDSLGQECLRTIVGSAEVELLAGPRLRLTLPPRQCILLGPSTVLG